MRKEDSLDFAPVVVLLTGGKGGVIRPLRPDDDIRLGDFYERIPPEDERFYCPHPLTREQAARKAAAAYEPFSVCLVLETPDKRIGGYAWYRWREATSPISTMGICVSRELQGCGAGKNLLTLLLQTAARTGPPRMALTVQKANPRAVSLYRRLGFVVVREQVRARDQEPEYYMERAVR